MENNAVPMILLFESKEASTRLGLSILSRYFFQEFQDTSFKKGSFKHDHCLKQQIDGKLVKLLERPRTPTLKALGNPRKPEETKWFLSQEKHECDENILDF